LGKIIPMGVKLNPQLKKKPEELQKRKDTPYFDKPKTFTEEQQQRSDDMIKDLDRKLGINRKKQRAYSKVDGILMLPSINLKDLFKGIVVALLLIIITIVIILSFRGMSRMAPTDFLTNNVAVWANGTASTSQMSNFTNRNANNFREYEEIAFRVKGDPIRQFSRNRYVYRMDFNVRSQEAGYFAMRVFVRSTPNATGVAEERYVNTIAFYVAENQTREIQHRVEITFGALNTAAHEIVLRPAAMDDGRHPAVVMELGTDGAAFSIYQLSFRR